MNVWQRSILAVGLGVFALAALCPPYVWYSRSTAGGSVTRIGLEGTRAWLWAPPQRDPRVFAQVNREQLTIEWIVVVVVTMGGYVLVGATKRPA